MGFVYEWINMINGKWYIGSHCGNNKNYTTSGIAINRAIKKYGIDNFICHKFYCDDYREQEELALIRKDARNNPMSYNLKNAAIGGDTRSGFKISDEVKLKIQQGSKTNRPITVNGTKYFSLREAERETGISRYNLRIYERTR